MQRLLVRLKIKPEFFERGCSSVAGLQLDEKFPHLYTKLSGGVHTVDPDFDFRERLSNLGCLEKNLGRRGVANVDFLHGIEQRYEQFVRATAEYAETGIELDDLNVDDSYSPEKKAEIKADILKHRKTLRAELKELTATVMDCLSLPADLLPETKDVPKILAEYPGTFLNDRNHFQLLQESGIVKTTKDPGNIYLEGRAVSLKSAMESFFVRELRKLDWLPISPPRMVRPAIVEGCYLDKSPLFTHPIYPSDELPVKNPTLQLVGTSLPSIAAVLMSSSPSAKSTFPLRLFSVGESYGRLRSEPPHSLFDTPQHPAVSLFLAEKSANDAEMEYGKLKLILRKLIQNFDINFYVQQEPAAALHSSESARVSFRSGTAPEDYSEQGPEILSISYHGQFISERLRLFQGGDHKKLAEEKKYLFVTSCQINLFALMACLLEARDFQNLPGAKSG